MKFWSILALAASVAAIPFEGTQLHKRNGERIYVGYRVVSKAEAEAINNNGGKAVASLGSGGRQLGQGTYISPGFQEWGETEGTWDCAVSVDRDTWNGLKKAWIPKSYEFPEDKEKDPSKCKPQMLWTPRWKANRQRFLTSLDASFTADNTVLFSKILGHEDHIQGLIPTPLLSSVEFYMQCAARGTESNSQIGSLGAADWNVASIKGWNMGSDEA